MATPTVIITYTRAARAERAYELAKLFEAIGRRTTVSTDDQEAVYLDDNTVLTWEAALAFVQDQHNSVPVAFVPLEHAQGLPLPAYETRGSAGLDLRAAIPEDETLFVNPGAIVIVPTGVTVALPAGLELQVRPRSGLAAKNGVTVLNSPGTVDSDYRGEIKVILINHGSEPFAVNRGDRIAQAVFAPYVRIRFDVVAELDQTERGTGGFGSTGIS